jgi:membrane-bound lytic murein transglycosylase D
MLLRNFQPSGFLSLFVLAVLVAPASISILSARVDASSGIWADPSAHTDEGGTLSVTTPGKFSVDDRLRKNVDFWISINTKYPTTQGLVHDTKYIDHVYEVLDLQGAPKNGFRVIKAAKRKWREVLLSLHRKQKDPDSWTDDEKKVAKLFEDVAEPNKFLNAAHRKRLRFQLGQRDRFLDGLVQSGRYLPLMEEVFRKEGLPVELTRLPFVESSFNLKARSKVGASGIWQFMRSTGKLFIRINDTIDERNDPLRATEAAAKLLKLNYGSLGSWPLAVTAYNHGRKGMMRAVRRVGSDELEELVSEYHSRSFGFASSNFFTELLASVEIEKNADKYFGKVERSKVLQGVEVEIPDYVAMKDLGSVMKLEPVPLRELNPALSGEVFSGRLLVPAGYILRLPADPQIAGDVQARVFMAGYSQIPDLYKLRTQKRESYVRRRPKRQSM